jgi:hypothetical protein
VTLRTYLYNQLTAPAEVELRAIFGDRIFPKRSMTSTVEETPYLTFKLGNDSSVDLSEESTANQQYFQIWVHDFTDTKTADYTLVDEGLAAVKALLHGAYSGPDNILNIKFLETSQDLNDDTLGTVFRYSRYIATLGS